MLEWEQNQIDQMTCFISHFKKTSTNDQDYCKEILSKKHTPIFFPYVHHFFLRRTFFPLLEIDHNHFHYIADYVAMYIVLWNKCGIKWFFQICTALLNFNQPFRLVFSLLLIPALPPIIFYLFAKAFEKDQLLCSLAVISSVSSLELSDLGLSVEREQLWRLSACHMPFQGIPLKSSKCTHLWKKK